MNDVAMNSTRSQRPIFACLYRFMFVLLYGAKPNYIARSKERNIEYAKSCKRLVDPWNAFMTRTDHDIIVECLNVGADACDEFVRRNPGGKISFLAAWNEAVAEAFGYRNLSLFVRNGDAVAGSLPSCMCPVACLGIQSLPSSLFIATGGLSPIPRRPGMPSFIARLNWPGKRTATTSNFERSGRCPMT